MTEQKQEKNNKAFEERSDKESAKEFYTEVNNAIQSIEDTSTSMSQLLEQHKSALDTFEQGVAPLYLLPQKTKNAVKISPKMFSTSDTSKIQHYLNNCLIVEHNSKCYSC